MKKLSYFLTLASAAAFLAVSCDSNDPVKFDDADAFVAFASSSVSVDEGVLNADGTVTAAETLRIPVSLASVKGLSETVSFEVNEITAKENVSWKLLTTSKTLSFDAENRTQYIEFQILYYDEYTGDLKFEVVLNKPAGINLGATSTCTVTVGDIDHPLVSILGSYTVTSTGSCSEPGYTMTLHKDDEDDHMVWFDNLFARSSWAIPTTRYYGNVSEDLTTITIPLGQTTEYEYPDLGAIVLYGMYGDAYDDDTQYVDSGSTTATIVSENGQVKILFASDCGFYAYLPGGGRIGYASPVLTAVKN